MIGFLATEEIRAHVQENVDDEHATLAQQEAQSLQAWSESNEQRVQTLIRNPELRSLTTTELRQYTQHPDRANAIHVVDTEDGEIVTSTDRAVEGASVETLSIPDADRMLDRMEPFSVYRSEPYVLNEDGGQPAVTYAQTTGDGAIGVVYTVELSQYAENFNTYGDNRSTTLVLDGDDRLVFDDEGYGEQHARFLERYGAPGDTVAESSATGSQTVAPSDRAELLSAYQFPDEEYVVGYAPVDGTDWIVRVHTPTADAYGFVTTVQWLGFAATASLVALITALGAVLGRDTARSINRLADRAARMESGDLNVDLETERIDEIGQLYDAFDSMRLSLQEQITEAKRARKEAERERRHIQHMNRDLTDAANEYADVMQAAAEGDFTVRMDPDATDTPPMAEIATEFNEMLERLEGTIARLDRFATEVAQASEEVSSSSVEVRTASENVARSIQAISAGADRQNEALQAVTREISDLSGTTREIADLSNDVATIANRTANAGSHGREAAEDAIEGMEAIETESESAVEKIDRLEAEVAEIDTLIEYIQAIADQTNMLALSTNLEAVRSSGKDGGEFANVAEEVKELSSGTKAAAAEIEVHLERIREQTQRSADAVARTSERIETTSRDVEEAVDALTDIAEYATETNTGIQEISTATDHQMDSTYEVVTKVSEVATISQETASGADTVVAATEEQTSALTEVSNSMSRLAERANQLSDALDRFDTEPPDADASIFDEY